jgi:predicted O-methyltransferase YrrM
MPKISLLIHTASYDNFLFNQGIHSYFETVTDCLKRQTFKDFEFIFIDAFYEDNKDNFKKIIKSLPFLVKHVAIHKNHRYWYDKGYCYISAAKNTGILYADGELVISCDDAELFPEQLLQKYWDHYQSGYLMLGVHKRMKSINTENGFPVYPITGEIYINDHRMETAMRKGDNNKVYHHKFGNWAFAGTSFKLEDAVFLNGYNERMDGCKSLEDCEFGERLSIKGNKFAIDQDGFFYIIDHSCYSDAIPQIPFENDGQASSPVPVKRNGKEISHFIAVENHGMFMCARELLEIKANRPHITTKHLEIIQRETIKYRQFDPLAPENAEKLGVWMQTPSFDLRKEREELRQSKDWIWQEQMILKEEQIKEILPTLHGWCTIEKAMKLVTLIQEHKLETCLEIGVFGGSSLIPQVMAVKANGKGMVYGIDPWQVEAALDGMVHEAHKSWWSTVNLEEIYQYCTAAITSQNLNPYCTLIRDKADNVVNQFADESLDLLHIDGNHSEDHAYNDAVNYLPKVKRGGYIMFDDIWWTEENNHVTTRKAILYLMQYCDKVDVINNDCLLLVKQ